MNNNFYIKSQSSPVKSFSQNLLDTREQVNKQYFFENFSKDEVKRVEEFCKIIADVLCLPENSMMQIAGECVYTSVVQDVFSQLDERHIEIVLENFKKIPYKVRMPKNYIRTALYNAYFEIECKIFNDENVRFAQND